MESRPSCTPLSPDTKRASHLYTLDPKIPRPSSHGFSRNLALSPSSWGCRWSLQTAYQAFRLHHPPSTFLPFQVYHLHPLPGQTKSWSPLPAQCIGPCLMFNLHWHPQGVSPHACCRKTFALEGCRTLLWTTLQCSPQGLCPSGAPFSHLEEPCSLQQVMQTATFVSISSIKGPLRTLAQRRLCRAVSKYQNLWLSVFVLRSGEGIQRIYRWGEE